MRSFRAEWAATQYDMFDEQRRIEAEAAAEERYWEDLNRSAAALEEERKKK